MISWTVLKCLNININITEPDIEGWAHEGGFAVFGAGSGVGRLRFRFIPVHIPLNQRQAVVHLIHRQQRHLGDKRNQSKKMKTDSRSKKRGNSLVWTQTCKLRSTSQLVSKSSSSSPKGFMSCSATWDHEQERQKTLKGQSISVTWSQHESVVPHLQPTNIEEKLQQGENREVEVYIVTRVPLSWIQELATNQTSQEEAVDRHRHHLVKRHESNLQVFHD